MTGERWVRIVLVREIPEEPSMLRYWNELVLQMEHTEVFYTPQWVLALQSAFKSAFKPPPKPLLFLGYDVDELVGVVCLSSDVGEQNVSFLAGTTADYCDFLSRPQRREEFVEAVLNELRQLKVANLVLANLPADSATPDALRNSAKKYGFHVYTRPAYVCPGVELGSAEQRRAFNSTVARKRQFRKCIRALEKRGVVTTEYLRTWPQIRAALPGFVDTHVARFRASGRGSFLFAPERRFLLEELARRFADTGVVTLTRLMVGDRPVAWSYGFQFHGSWFLYQTTFDIGWAEDSPGYCLLGKILIEACEATTLRAVDLGLGSEEYKRWFANSRRETVHVTITSSAVRHVGGIARYRIASEVKKIPKLERAIRNARTRLGL
jgi:CelD/BcsL family acetyltransferase involved in cellulose biosynthesis